MNPELVDLLVRILPPLYFIGGLIPFIITIDEGTSKEFYFKTKRLSTLGIICKRVLLFGGFIIMLILITFVNLFISKKIKY